MLAPEAIQSSLCRRIPMVVIDQMVSTRLGRTRVRGNAQPAAFNRQIAMYLAKHVGGWSTTGIGRFYNGRDHSTVCYALKRVAALRQNDPEVDGLVSSLADEIKAARPVENGRWDTRLRRRLAQRTCTSTASTKRSSTLSQTVWRNGSSTGQKELTAANKRVPSARAKIATDSS
jgi:hypothetical protein